MSLPTSHPKFRQMMTLLTQSNQIGHRHTLAFNISNGRTESTKDLTEKEVDAVIALLKHHYPQRQAFTPKPGDKQRKKMLTLAGKMQWGATMPQLVKAVDAWCLKQKYKRGLMQLDVHELNVLVTVLENEVLPSFYKSFNK